MSSRDPKGTAPQDNSPQENEGQQAATAVLEKPKKWEPTDGDRVTVLYGWNKVPAGSKQFVDKVLFKDGIARNVLYSTVKHWQQGTRPDGKNDQVYGKVGLQAVLPADATEADFIEATGITPMPAEKFAAQLAGVDLDELAAQLGTDRLKKLVEGLDKHLPKHLQRG